MRKHDVQLTAELPANEEGPGWGRSGRHATSSIHPDRPQNVAARITANQRDRVAEYSREKGDIVMPEAKCAFSLLYVLTVSRPSSHEYALVCSKAFEPCQTICKAVS
jgi:hypothetical protein